MSIDINVQLESAKAMAAELNKVLTQFGTITDKFTRTAQALNNQFKNINKSDLIGVSRGTTARGQVNQAMVSGKVSDLKQLESSLIAMYSNAHRQALANISKSVEANITADLVKSRQSRASMDAQIRKLQIEAQQARVALSQTGRSAGAGFGISARSLGTPAQEQAALDKLLATDRQITAEQATQSRLMKDRESVQARINAAKDAEVQKGKESLRQVQLEMSIARQNISMAQAVARGSSVDQLKVRAKTEALRLELMISRGVKETDVEYQNQLNLIRSILMEQQKLKETNAQLLVQEREKTALANSESFANGTSNRQQIVTNNIIGSRKAAMSPQGQASLLELQGMLMTNYALIGGFASAIQGTITSIVDLDAELRQLQAIAGATNEEFGLLRQTVLDVSKNTKFSSTEIAEAATLLAQAGQSTAQINDSLAAVADFAMAVGTDLSTAVDIVTTTLTVFKMTSAETTHITNVFTEALNRSKLSIEQLQLGFQYAANIVADAGGTFEELTATLAGMSQAGIRSGSMLGTGLRQILVSLADPTDKVTILLGKLGLSLDDVDVRAHGVVGVLKAFADAGLTAEQAMGAFETRTASALVAATNQIDFIQQIQESLILSNAAEEASAKQKESLANSTNILKNTFLSLVNDAAEPVLKFFIALAQSVATLLNTVPALSGVLKTLGTILIGLAIVTVTSSVAKLIGNFIAFSGVIKVVNGSLGTAGLLLRAIPGYMAASTTATGAFSAATGLLGRALATLGINPVMLAIMGISAAAYGAYEAIKYFTGGMERLQKQSDEIQTSIDANNGIMDNFKAAADQVDVTLDRLNNRMADLTSQSNGGKDAVKALHLEALDAQEKFNRFGAAIDADSESLDTLITKLQNTRIEMMRMTVEAQKATLALEQQNNVVLGKAANQAGENAGKAVSLAQRTVGLNYAGIKQYRPALAQIASEWERVQASGNVAAVENFQYRLSQSLASNKFADRSKGFGGAAGIPDQLVNSMMDSVQSYIVAQNKLTSSTLRIDALQTDLGVKTAAVSDSYLKLTASIKKETGYTASNTASAYDQKVRSLDAQKTAGKISPEEYKKQLGALNATRDAQAKSATMYAARIQLEADKASDPGMKQALQTEADQARSTGNVLSSTGTVNDAAAKKLQDRLDRKNAAAARRAEEAIDAQIRELEKAFRDVASVFTQSFKLKLKGIRGYLSEGTLDTKIKEAEADFETSQKYLTEFYEKKKELVKGDAVKTKSVSDEMQQALENNQEQFQQGLEDAIQRIPSIGQKLQLLFKAADAGLARIGRQLDKARSEVDQLTASRSATGDLMGIMQRQGVLSGSEAAAVDNNFQKRIDEATLRQRDAVMKRMKQQLSAVNDALNIAGSGDNLKVDGVQYTPERIDAAVEAQRNYVTSLKDANDTSTKGIENLARQEAKLKDMEASQSSINGYLDKQIELNREITAQNDAQAAAEEARSESTADRINKIIDYWKDQNGYNVDGLTRMLDHLTGVLDDTQKAFDDFFFDIFSGTKQVGDAFRDMANSILSSMLRTVTSEIAKSVMKFLLDMIKKILTAKQAASDTGTTGSIISSAISWGASLFGMRLGGPITPSGRGMVRAANGIGIHGRDSVPILAMPGEYLLRKSAVDAIGMDNLDKVNAAGNTFQSGLNQVPNASSYNQSNMQQPQPLNIYVVTPDKQPGESSENIIVRVTENIVNRGPVYKAVKAVQQGTM